jgi:XTP/dITP diphosphohydrolase
MGTRRLVIATTNQGKFQEILGILRGVPIDLVALTSLPPIPEPPETGTTFAENARSKALYYASATHLPCVAEDSGLEIAALDNAPGVHSARWHGSDYSFKFKKIYELLRQRGLSGSCARFVCRLSVALPESPEAAALGRQPARVHFEAEGIISGEIAPEPRGENGFGYDPIFYYPPLNRTLAQLPQSEKARVSHRGQAFAALREHLAAHPELLDG